MLPVAVQINGVVLMKLTVRPELAVALAVVGAPPTVRVGGVKLMVPIVWLPWPTAMVWDTGGAGK